MLDYTETTICLLTYMELNWILTKLKHYPWILSTNDALGVYPLRPKKQVAWKRQNSFSCKFSSQEKFYSVKPLLFTWENVLFSFLVSGFHLPFYHFLECCGSCCFDHLYSALLSGCMYLAAAWKVWQHDTGLWNKKPGWTRTGLQLEVVWQGRGQSDLYNNVFFFF